jgi:hypothetical protein
MPRPDDPDRRLVLTGSMLAATATELGAPAVAQVLAQAPQVTQILADYLVRAKFEDLPAAVRKEAARSFLNWVGVTIGGSRQGAVTSAVAALSPFSGKSQANLLGRSEKLDILHAALINGISSHVLDYDDTHLKTIIHPAGPVASALLALGQDRPLSGAQFLHALVLGIETECRIGNAVFPSHYDMGWHITGTCGVFGAAAACGKVLVGLKVQFGSMTKSFHAGRAAQNGPRQRCWRRRTSLPTMRRWKARTAGPRRWRGNATGARSPKAWAAAMRPRSTPTSPLPAESSPIPRSMPPSSCVPRTSCARRTLPRSSCGPIRWCCP